MLWCIGMTIFAFWKAHFAYKTRLNCRVLNDTLNHKYLLKIYLMPVNEGYYWIVIWLETNNSMTSSTILSCFTFAIIFSFLVSGNTTRQPFTLCVKPQDAACTAHSMQSAQQIYIDAACTQCIDAACSLHSAQCTMLVACIVHRCSLHSA